MESAPQANGRAMFLPRQGRPLFILAASVLTLCGTGCAGLETMKTACGFGPPGPKTGQVAQITACWANGLVVHPDRGAGGQPTPGFSGRIMLYGPGMTEALKGDGIITVSLRHDLQKDPTKPQVEWNLACADLEPLLRKDVLGWGYDVWLPWATYQPDVKKATLRVVYTPRDGAPVYSNDALIVLNKGPAVIEQHTTTRLGQPVRGGQQATGPSSPGAR